MKAIEGAFNFNTNVTNATVIFFYQGRIEKLMRRKIRVGRLGKGFLPSAKLVQ